MGKHKRNRSMVQSILVTLSNGTVLTYHGPAQVGKDETSLRIVDVTFTPPRRLPKDMKWETVDSTK